MDENYRICTRCVMDTVGDERITFDEQGVCNYCHGYTWLHKTSVPDAATGARMVAEKVAEIKAARKPGGYDCIMGLSGGVDSSYLAYIAKREGLNPLCIHFDNGWNSEQAVQNIHHIVHKLGFDLETYVIDWDEFRDLQRAYFKASVIDIEALTDHAIFASMYKLAFRMGIRYVLSGSNVVTEAILPEHWTHRKSDYINIIDIHRKYGSIPIKSFPMIDKKTKDRIRSWGLQTVEMLNWIPYDKKEAKQTLIRELDWQDYGGKHYESIFTKFYQAYILPVKFHVDKRKAHLSTLICSGQMTREQALAELQLPLYDPKELKKEKEYVLKKLGFTEEEFDEMMSQKPVPHNSFEVEGSLFNYYPILKPVRPLWEYYKKLVGR
ncbi:MAG: N-acetyl sugar amidotransferase [Chitinophagia bacterium]|nr:N-acetyl sugar amidotransferase [Chitinophagia bacterium]